MPRPPVTARMLARRWWLLLAGPVLGVALAMAISGIAVSASSSFAVSTVGGYQPPYQLDRLALTYAQLLPEEPRVIGAVSRATGVSPDYVRDHLTMTAKRETNIVFARFSAADTGTALAALAALARVFERESDLAGSSLRRTVRQISPPAATHGFSRRKALALGALAGLLIALSIALALEGRVPRVDDLEELAGVVALPVSQARRGTLGELIGGEGTDGDAAVRVLPFGGPGGRGVLLVARGAPVAAVEDACRANVASGRPLDFALLLRPDSPLGRLRAR
jgi:hypothetical protein